MDLRLMLTHEGATCLREWANAVPRAIESIEDSTLNVVSIYQSVAESVGLHRESFYQMLLCIKRAQEQFADALGFFPQGLRATADKIDDYVNNSDEGEHQPPVKKLMLHR